MAPPPPQLSDYLTRVSESISNQKQNRLAKSLSQTSDPTYNVLLALQDVETKSSLEMMIGRRGAALGLDTEWRGILVDRIWAGLMELKEQWIEAYTSQKSCINNYIRLHTTLTSTSWVLPPLYVLLHDLRHLSLLADTEWTARQFEMREQQLALGPQGQGGVQGQGQGQTTSMGAEMKFAEDCARVFQSGFKVCVGDRSNPQHLSKRKGVYRMANLNLKWYFKIDRTNLSKQLVRAVQADPTIPPLSSFKLCDRVTWKYYLGLLAFRAGDDEGAATELGWAWDWCLGGSRRNQELILMHLIPARLRLGLFPSRLLLTLFPRIDHLYGKFIGAIRSGDVRGYDRALERLQSGALVDRAGEDLGAVSLAGQRDQDGEREGEEMQVDGMRVDVAVWMAMERGREVCLRGLIRGVWVAMVKTSRIPIESFRIALQSQGVSMDVDEVECLLAGMIWKGYMKGYISHEKRTVVLAKNGPFPALNQRVKPKGG